MSQQINLVNQALRKPFDWLSATPVAIAVGVVVGLLVTATSLAKVQTEARQKTADQLDAKLKTAQDKLTAMAKTIAESKQNPQLAADLASVQAIMKSRQEIMQLLEGGGLGQTSGFADYLSGLARQVPSGLWLSSVAIGAGGSGMEIQGRMVHPSALPEYIHRLSNEKVFKGHSFSSLTINRPDAGKEKPPAAGILAAGKANTAQAGFVEFVLRPNVQNWSGAESPVTAPKVDATPDAPKADMPPGEEKKT